MTTFVLFWYLEEESSKGNVPLKKNKVLLKIGHWDLFLFTVSDTTGWYPVMLAEHAC